MPHYTINFSGFFDISRSEGLSLLETLRLYDSARTSYEYHQDKERYLEKLSNVLRLSKLDDMLKPSSILESHDVLIDVFTTINPLLSRYINNDSMGLSCLIDEVEEQDREENLIEKAKLEGEISELIPYKFPLLINLGPFPLTFFQEKSYESNRRNLSELEEVYLREYKNG